MRRLLLGLLFLMGINEVHAEPLKVVFISGSFEYFSDESLESFQEYLEAHTDAEVTFLSARGDWNNLPGLEALEDCDVALFFTRRLEIEGEQLDRIKRYARSDKPVVGVRTANHGFQKYLEFDPEVLGGNYHANHGGGIAQELSAAEGQEKHPVLEGVPSFSSNESLYKVQPLAEDCEVLMVGKVPSGATEPVVWVRDGNKKVVNITLGGVQDFKNEPFKRLVANALFWAAQRPVEWRVAAPRSE